VPGEQTEGVADALDFLRRVNRGDAVRVPRQIAVVGGGNSALDAARCARRLGAETVYLVYRRTRAEMPAHEREVADAEAEGVRILYLALPLAVKVEAGQVAGLRCAAGFLEPREVKGRRPSCGVAGAEFTLDCQMVLCAVGQHPDGALMEAQGVPTRENDTALADAETCATDAYGVFAAGDAAGRPGSAVEAIADGRRAAAAIDRFLAGEPLEPAVPDTEPVALEARQVLTRHIEEPDLPRVALPEREPAERVGDFGEIEATLDEETARREAERCLACGCGVGCGLCEKVCIYGAIERRGDTFVIDAETCDGCGLCTVRCAHGAIEMIPND
jgi:NADPH-dependent glutamate synthase beta subunit-like oxidoreductase